MSLPGQHSPKFRIVPILAINVLSTNVTLLGCDKCSYEFVEWLRVPWVAEDNRDVWESRQSTLSSRAWSWVEGTQKLVGKTAHPGFCFREGSTGRMKES